MTIPRARVLRGVAGAALDLAPSRPRASRARVVPRAVAEAHEEARRVLERAEARAREIVERATLEAARLFASAEDDARREGAAKLAAAWTRLADEERSRDERALERTTLLARALAERLLGAELRTHPDRVVDLAREALAHASRARRVVISAHADDAEILLGACDELAPAGASLEIRVDTTRSRGSLRVETDLGTLDAELAPQLDKLVAVLRDELAGHRSG